MDHVSFRIPKGEIFGFLGSNGCGKTTTMKMLTGLLEPTEGIAMLFGHGVDARDMAVRRRVGFVSQAVTVYTVTNRTKLPDCLYAFGSVRAGKVQLASIDVLGSPGGQHRRRQKL